jgi:RHS repeat-associated protein
LNSIEKVLDFNSGNIISTSSFTSFGNQSKSKATNFNKGYIGGQQDQSNLSYLNDRYLNNDYATFLSPDVVVNSLGNDQKATQQYIQDPQNLNSFNYSRNDPINKSDPSGKCFTQSFASQAGCAAGAVEALTGAVQGLSNLGNLALYNTAGRLTGQGGTANALNSNLVQGIKNIPNSLNQFGLDYTNAYLSGDEYATGKMNGNLLLTIGSLFAGGEGVVGDSANVSSKILGQLSGRGWTENMINEVVNNPYTVRQGLNKANGNVTDIFYQKNGSYVSVDRGTKDIIQISNRNDKNWIPILL